MKVSIADVDDAAAIATLVNAAYRPTSGTAGWTHERELVSGPRIDAAQVLATIGLADSVILVAKAAGHIDACVQLQPRGEVCLLGLLAVDPEQQDSGLGKRLLAHAEHFASATWGCTTIRISVLSQRPELLAYYRRRGYRATGAVTPYPRQTGLGSPIIEGLSVDTLEKSATSGTPA